MDLTETKLYGINEEEDWRGAFYVTDNDSPLSEKDEHFKIGKRNRIDIYIKEACGNEPYIYLRDNQGNICRIKLRTAEYQRDAYKKEKRHILSKNELIAFDKYMHENVPGTNILNWVHLSIDWNDAWSSANEGKTSGLVNLNKGCPDYLNIKEPK